MKPRSGGEKRKRFDFAATKAAATSDDRTVRKTIFLEYFEDFATFPSYLFDNEAGIDAKLKETMQDLLKDPETPKKVRAGVDELLQRFES